MRSFGRLGWLAGAAVLAVAGALWLALGGDARSPDVAAAAPSAAAHHVSAIGRLEPRGGVMRIAGPSDLVVVVGRVEVREGDLVEKNQIVAYLDDYEVRRAEVARARAELRNARVELERNRELHAGKVIPDSLRDQWELRADVALANLEREKAHLALAEVRSPIEGQILEIHAHDGERVDVDGFILEVGRTHEMYAIAEVYETDAGLVKEGQRARVFSRALATPLYGVVDHVGLKVGKADALGTDPAARTDARVIEVDVRLDDSETAARLTNLQVEIEIGLDDQG